MQVFLTISSFAVVILVGALSGWITARVVCEVDKKTASYKAKKCACSLGIALLMAPVLEHWGLGWATPLMVLPSILITNWLFSFVAPEPTPAAGSAPIDHTQDWLIFGAIAGGIGAAVLFFVIDFQSGSVMDFEFGIASVILALSGAILLPFPLFGIAIFAMMIIIAAIEIGTPAVKNLTNAISDSILRVTEHNGQAHETETATTEIPKNNVVKQPIFPL